VIQINHRGDFVLVVFFMPFANFLHLTDNEPMRLSAFAIVTLLLAFSLFTRAATFAQRNLPEFSSSPSAVSVSKVAQNYGESDNGLVPTPHCVKRIALLRNICFADPMTIPGIYPKTTRFLTPPADHLVSAQLSRPVRPPAC
jgi:hypothetical protein